MNVAKHMEALFLGATLVFCSLAWASPAQGVTEPGIASHQEQVQTSAAPQDTPVQTVVVIGKRQH